MDDKTWQRFLQTGSVHDYLQYKAQAQQPLQGIKDESNGNVDKGLGDTGADRWGG